MRKILFYLVFHTFVCGMGLLACFAAIAQEKWFWFAFNLFWAIVNGYFAYIKYKIILYSFKHVKEEEK